MLHHLLLPLVLAAPVPKDSRPLRNADPPKEWKLADVFDAMLGVKDPGPVHVLAWEVIDTKRGYILEVALVVKAMDRPADDSKNFVLAYVRRRPKAENPAWQFASSVRTETKPNGVPVIVTTEGFRFTAKPPTNDEVGELLTEMHWADLLTPGKSCVPELKSGGVVYANWKAALGRDPSADLFPELKATAK